MHPGQAVVREGKALVYLPRVEDAVYKGSLEPSWLRVFYNPRMTLNRDLSVAALQAYIDLYAPHKPVNVVEPLTATGVRPVRYALEVEGVGFIYASDIDREAVRLAKLNAESNGASNVLLFHSDARALLYKLKTLRTPILVVDIDPFGSPAPFLQAALEALGDRGMIAATATDLAVLEGSKSRAAYRKYWARIVRVPPSKEIAVRVLLGYMARVAASLDKSLHPLLSYYEGHYIRVYALVERGARAADKMLGEHVGYAYHCDDKGYTGLVEPPCDNAREIGPLWTGGLWDKRYLERVYHEASRRRYLQSRDSLLKLLDIIIEEAEVDGFIHQRIDALASALRTSMPKRRRLLEALRSMGYNAVRTHFTPVGFRSNAPIEALTRVFKPF